jgi:hypothetical protein
VFCDAARDSVPGEAVAVAELLSWAKDWCARVDAHLHVAETNLGLRGSIVSGVSKLLATHESVVVLEDDLLLSPAFLVFMNQALQSYRDREDIMQVSGYFVPHSGQLPSIGLLRAPASWGWATWRRAWAHYSDDARGLLNQVKKLDVGAFDINNSYGYLDSLEKNAAGTLDTWAVRWYASMFIRGGLALYPGETFTRNIGFGEEGTNCKPSSMDSVYLTQKIRRRAISPDWQSVGIRETIQFACTLESFYRWQSDRWTREPLGTRLRASLSKLVTRPVRT